MAELRSVRDIGQDTKEVVWAVSSVTKSRAKLKATRANISSFGPGWSTDVRVAEKENTVDGLRYIVTTEVSKREIVNDKYENAVEGAADKWEEAFTRAFDSF